MEKQINLLHYVFAILCTLGLWVSEVHGRKTFIIIGVTGVGKSTLGNCIINQSPSFDDIKRRPFETASSINSITRGFQTVVNSQTRVVDTTGFGDPRIEQQEVLKSLRGALESENFKVDAVLFVIRPEPMRRDTVDFFKLTQHELLKNKTRLNSVLVCNGCDDDWLENERASNQLLNSILTNCNDLSYNFKIALSENKNGAEDVEKRRMAITSLGLFLSELQLNKVDLSFIKTEEYETYFNKRMSVYMYRFGVSLGVVGALAAGFKAAFLFG